MASDNTVTVAKIGLLGVVVAAVIGLVPFIWTQVTDDDDAPATTVGIPTSTAPSSSGEGPVKDVAVFLSKESGPGGATVNVSGEGFESGERVELSMQTIQLATTTANQAGSFSNVAVTIPEQLSPFAPAQFDLTARGISSLRFGSAPFTVSG